MTKVKKFFNITEKYKFELNDLRALVTVLNVTLTIIFGLAIAWFGLFTALVGLIRDLITDRHINGIIMHFASIVLNIHFLLMLYL